LHRYASIRADDKNLTERLMPLVGQKRRYGYRRLHVLLYRDGWLINRKRTYRMYHEAGLMECRRKRKQTAGIERPALAASDPSQSSSMEGGYDA
jgi:putative transposase